MWISGGITPDHSVIGRFAIRHADFLNDELFVSLTKKVLKMTGSNCDSVAGDGTVIESSASRFSMIKKEAAEQAHKEAKDKADDEPEDIKLQKKAKKAEQVDNTLNERIKTKKAKGKKADNIKVSKTDPDAMNQPLKNKVVRASYKPSVMANDKRVIVAASVDPSCETKVIGSMIKDIEKLSGISPKQCMLDAGYFCDEVIDIALEKNIDLLCPEGRLDANGKTTKQSKKQFPKNSFTYNEDTDTYFCPAKQELTPFRKYKGNSQNPAYVKYGTKQCKNCSIKAQCTRSNKGRSIKHYKGDEAKEALRQVMMQPAAQKRYKKRQAWVEPVFSEIKGCLGLNRFRRKGLAAVKMEFFLHAMAYNLRKAVFAASVLGIFNSINVFLTLKSLLRAFLSKKMLIKIKWTFSV